MSVAVYDARICELGEGPLWHPKRKQLFWFDIIGKKLLSQVDGAPMVWAFDRHVSAAGWVDRDRLLIASETDLCLFDLSTGQADTIAPLEADNPTTRSNDGRADPFGGFWIGTMGKSAEKGMSNIYRYYRGEVRTVIKGLTIPNAICFAPDGSCAYYADTLTNKVMRQPLDGDGWPKGDATVFIDHGDNGHPDGAVVDAEGRIWNAHWGYHKVTAHDADGRLVDEYRLPCRQPSCPAFGGADFTQLFVTSAREHMGDAAGEADGLTYHLPVAATGLPEYQVIL